MATLLVDLPLRYRLLALAVLLFSGGLGDAAPVLGQTSDKHSSAKTSQAVAEKAANLDRAAIATLIRQLDDDEYQSRQDATRRLSQVGATAIEPLAAAAAGDSLEVAFRALEVLKELGCSDDPSTEEAAFASIESLAARSLRSAERAKTTLVALRRMSHTRAMDRLKQLGAVINGNGANDQERVFAGVGAGGAGIVVGRVVVGGGIAGADSDLYIGGTSVQIGPNWKGTPRDLKLLRRLERVDQLRLSGPEVTDEWLAELKGAAGIKLRALELKRTKVTDRGLANLAHLESLTYLDLFHTAVTDESVATISSLANLQYARLFGTKITANGATLLQTTLPNVRVDRRSGALLGVGGLVGEQPCVINTVQPKSAAAQAGIVEGDTVLKFDGKAVANFTELTAAIADKSGGDKVAIELLRATADGGSKPMSVIVTLGEW